MFSKKEFNFISVLTNHPTTFRAFFCLFGQVRLLKLANIFFSIQCMNTCNLCNLLYAKCFCIKNMFYCGIACNSFNSSNGISFLLWMHFYVNQLTADVKDRIVIFTSIELVKWHLFLRKRKFYNIWSIFKCYQTIENRTRKQEFSKLFHRVGNIFFRF